ncbi:MAG: hypothetical protein AAF684_02315, partial [Pseudomonadota bacterium]
MKMFAIARRRTDRDAADFAKFGDAEWRQAFTFVVEGFSREIYSMADGGGAVMVIEADDVESAQAKFAELPFVQNDLLD